MERSEQQPNVLDDPLAVGDELARAASMVGDQDDMHAWRSKRNAWAEDTARLLRESADLVLEAGEFRRSAYPTRPKAAWQEALPDEIERLHRAISLLKSLRRARRGELRSVVGKTSQ